MEKEGVVHRVRRVAFGLLVLGSMTVFTQLSALATGRVTLAWDPSADSSVVGYTINYGAASRSYTNTASVGNLTSVTISNLVEGTTYFFAAKAYNSANIESDFSNEASYLVPVAPSANQPPTLGAISSLTLAEDAGLQTVNLAGIGSGAANENQPLTVTATSSNTGLIPNPTITYTSPNTTGTLRFTPVANANGTATITVTVNDGQTQSNTVSRTFTVTVNAVNDAPTLGALSNLAINEGAALQTVNLTGINSGVTNENQALTVTAVSSNPGLIPNPTVNYNSPATNGTLGFTPVTYAYGTATITVTVNDGATSNNTLARTFTVTVSSVNQPPTLDPVSDLTIIDQGRALGARTVTLSGITSGAPNESQTLTVTAASSNPGLIPNPTVNYTSPNPTGTMSFTPAIGIYGTARVTVTVRDGGASNNVVTRTFNVAIAAVNQPPTLDPINHVAVTENAGVQTVTLSGISSGATNEFQTLSVSAVSSHPALIPNPTANYSSPSSAGSLSFTAVSNAFGGALITVTVNDGANGTATQAFWVAVNAAVAQLNLGSTVLQAGQSGSVPVNVSSSEGVTDISVVLDVPAGHLTNLALQALAPEINPASATILAQSGTTALLHLASRSGQSILGTKQVAQLTFTAIANQQSAFVPLTVAPFGATKTDGAQLSGRPAQSGRVVVVANEALVEATRDASGNRSLILYGKPSTTLAIEYTTSMNNPNWTRLTPGISLSTLATPVPLLNSSGLILYRAAKLSSPP